MSNNSLAHNIQFSDVPDFKRIIIDLKQKLLELQLLQDHILYISDDTQPYFESIVKGSNFLFLSYRTASRLLIVEFFKVIKHDENNNIAKLVTLLIKHCTEISWDNPISIVDLKIIRKKINTITSSEDYKMLYHFRSKYIAHDDSDKVDFYIEVHHESFFKILRTIQSIFNTITYHLTNQEHSFDFLNKPHELSALYRLRQIQEYLDKEFKKNRDLGQLKKIHDIVFGIDDMS